MPSLSPYHVATCCAAVSALQHHLVLQLQQLANACKHPCRWQSPVQPEQSVTTQPFTQALYELTRAGFYGNSTNQTFNESSQSGADYLAEVCRDWEEAAKKAKTKRVVIIRTGIVLSKEGGALAKMLPIFNIFAGGPLGTGQQWCSWIHRSGSGCSLKRSDAVARGNLCEEITGFPVSEMLHSTQCTCWPRVRKSLCNSTAVGTKAQAFATLQMLQE